jgi:transitional endoplasmic reticulum ATPase
VDAAFFTVKPSEILSKWVGEAEKNIEELFEEARSLPVSVIFVDEIDALAPRRSETSSPVMTRLVPQILAEMEGFEHDDQSCLMFLGATNEPWLLDPAILRPGRFDESIYVGLPDAPALRRLLEIHLADRPLADDFDFEAAARKLGGYSGADIRRLAEQAASEAFLDSVDGDGDRKITSADLLRQIGRSPPSVSIDTVKKYEKYRAAREGTFSSPPREFPQAGEVLRDS